MSIQPASKRYFFHGDTDTEASLEALGRREMATGAVLVAVLETDLCRDILSASGSRQFPNEC